MTMQIRKTFRPEIRLRFIEGVLKKITVKEFFGDANILMSSDRTRRLTKNQNTDTAISFSG